MSIGSPIQNLWPNLIFGWFPPCNYNVKQKSDVDFCLWVYEFETFCGSFIHHLAAMVQRTLQNSTKKFFWDTQLAALFLFVRIHSQMAYWYIEEEDDDVEEYTKGENESRDNQRGAKKIENSWRYMRRGNGLLLRERLSAINLSTGVYARWENTEGRKLSFDWYRDLKIAKIGQNMLKYCVL